jgi:hypothetical protein
LHGRDHILWPLPPIASRVVEFASPLVRMLESVDERATLVLVRSRERRLGSSAGGRNRREGEKDEDVRPIPMEHDAPIVRQREPSRDPRTPQRAERSRCTAASFSPALSQA